MTQHKSIGNLLQGVIDYRESNKREFFTEWNSDERTMCFGLVNGEHRWEMNLPDFYGTLHELQSEYRKLMRTPEGRADVAKQISAGLSIKAIYEQGRFEAREIEVRNYDGAISSIMQVYRNGRSFTLTNAPMSVTKAYCKTHDYSRHIMMSYESGPVLTCVLCGAEMFTQLRQQLINDEKSLVIKKKNG